ncbi:hypothetical protein SLS62_003158 [Diatrype stigma]|uniref:Uncharacterized protein n=1 Tax=Diatrype stigma TaxID=117547 RepID=A0AAN9V5D4_9PEZI
MASSSSPLALHIQQETQRWESLARQRRQRQQQQHGESALDDDESRSCTSESNGSASDLASMVSTALTSIEAEDPDVLPQPPLPQNTDGTPIPVYGSLGEAAQQSTAGVLEPRRLVTPGKLYENEEDDDEIFEYDVVVGGGV